MGKVLLWLPVSALMLLVVAGRVSGLSDEETAKGGVRAVGSDVYPLGDPRHCVELARKSDMPIKRFEVLPGLGWDNLRNLEAGQVVSYNYSQCKTTDDGRFLIPDGTFSIPLKASYVETFAELIDSWHNSTSTTANGVNVEAGLNLPHVGISGKFSFEHTRMKAKQIEDKAVTTRVQLRYHRYETKLQPDTPLHPSFRKRLLDIAGKLELNRTEEAYYDGQLLVRDFGTHVLTSVTAGAGLVKTDFLKRNIVDEQSEDKTSILAQASASFFSVFHVSVTTTHSSDSKTSDSYNKSLTHSFMTSHGGPILRAYNMTSDEWTAGVDLDLVPVDRAGDPLYFLVTEALLPELPHSTVVETERVVRKSIEMYYEMNVIPGCTKMGSPNFSFSANFDDGSCKAKATNLTFGGVYQTCAVAGRYLYKNPCQGRSQVNPKTSHYSCPSSYTAVKLMTSRSTQQAEHRRSCHSCYLFWHCCDEEDYYSEAVYETYWCAATGHVSPQSGYLFGGLYTSTTDNPVTGNKECPLHYYGREMFDHLTVCISDDYELGAGSSVPFGGFISCEVGNPLSANGVTPVGSSDKLEAPPLGSLSAFMKSEGGAGKWPKRCPEGYSQHMATMAMGCEIRYCVQSGSLSAPNLPPVKRPPFNPKPAVIAKDDNLVMFDLASQTWVKNQKAIRMQQKLTKAMAVNNVGESEQEMSPGTAAGITVGVTLACVAITSMLILLVRRKRSQRGGAHGLLREETVERTNYGAA